MDRFQYGGILFDPSHYQALSYIESKHNNKLFINPDFKKGKAGYMQLSPIAFADLKEQGFFKDREYNSLTPQEVLAGSMKYASRLGEHYGFTDPKWNAAAYNMGPSKARELYNKYAGKLNKAVLDPAFPQTTKDYLFDYNYTTLTKERHGNEDVNKMYDIIKNDQDVNSLNIDTMKKNKTPKYFWGAIIQAAANKVKEEKAKDKAFMNSSNMGAAGTALGSMITSAGDAIGTQEDASKANVIQGAAVSTLGGLMSGGIMGGLIAAPTSLIKYSANAIAQGSRKETQQEAWINGHTTGIDTGTNYQFKMGGVPKYHMGAGAHDTDPPQGNTFGVGVKNGPTAKDSLDLYNNTKKMMAYKPYHAYENQEINPIFSKNLLFAQLAAAKLRFEDRVNPNNPASSDTVQENKDNKDNYYKVLDKNKFAQRDMANAVVDWKAPAGLYDKRITPHGTWNGSNFNENIGVYGDAANIPLYDPIRVKPVALLTKAERKLREAGGGKFFPAGTFAKGIHGEKTAEIMAKQIKQSQPIGVDSIAYNVQLPAPIIKALAAAKQPQIVRYYKNGENTAVSTTDKFLTPEEAGFVKKKQLGGKTNGEVVYAIPQPTVKNNYGYATKQLGVVNVDPVLDSVIVENGAPNINTNPLGANNPHYNGAGIFVGNDPEQLKNNIIEELAHAKQHATYDEKRIDDLNKRENVLRYTNQGPSKNWPNKADSVVYNTPGTIEYDAHKVVAPKLREEYHTRRTRDISNRRKEMGGYSIEGKSIIRNTYCWKIITPANSTIKLIDTIPRFPRT